MSCKWFDKNKVKPSWLEKSPGNRNHARGLRYYNKLWKAQPAWADTSAIRLIYTRRDDINSEGGGVEVDHIVPLSSKVVCGLHVANNLQIIKSAANRKKSNYSFPGMAMEQLGLLDHLIAPPDFSLEMS